LKKDNILIVSLYYSFDGDIITNISKPSLKGYILEEAIAYLLRNAGYKLLIDESQDPDELNNGSNGLEIKGRGGNHQVDVLGELNWIPAFTFPVRLIIEAKHRSDPTYIDVIRESVGVINDVNNKYNFKTSDKLPPKQYNYLYSVFSTSSFSSGAVDYGLAHQISLIDMNIDVYNDLFSAIDEISQRLLEEDFSYKRGEFIKSTRNSIRDVLGTASDAESIVADFSDERMIEIIQEKTESIIEYEELFIGMTNGPFILLLKADTPEQFLDYARERPEHKIRIHWSWEDSGALWRISPLEEEDERYELKFKLPEKIHDWIHESEKKKAEKKALGVKERYFTDITIYRYDRGRPRMFRLKYDPLKYDSAGWNIGSSE